MDDNGMIAGDMDMGTIVMRYVLLALLAAGLALTACAAEPSTDPADAPPANAASAPMPPTVAPIPAAADTPATTDMPTPIPYDSHSAMYKVFPGFGVTSNRTYDALEEVRLSGDKSMTAVLVETMRYQSTPKAREASAGVLRDLTGEQYGGEDWKQWTEWLGRNGADYPPPDGYLDWKISVMAQLHPRFGQFLRPARSGAISVDPTEILWGGVIPDGIPDLLEPKMLAADEAEFLDDDERVFGVSINGDARAYPLRIINGHEMVNDVVGGEPIALAW